MSQETEGRQEQRIAERSAIELRVEYQRLNTFFYDYTKNISRGGTFVRTNRPLGVGTRFTFRLFIPTLVDPLQLTGEVRWIRRESEPGGSDQAGMGIQFVFESEEQRALVDGMVEKMMVESLGRLIYSRLRELEGF